MERRKEGGKEEWRKIEGGRSREKGRQESTEQGRRMGRGWCQQDTVTLVNLLFKYSDIMLDFYLSTSPLLLTQFNIVF